MTHYYNLEKYDTLYIKYKSGFIFDPLSQTDSHASSSEHGFMLFCFSKLEKWGRTDNMYENNYPYWP